MIQLGQNFGPINGAKTRYWEGNKVKVSIVPKSLKAARKAVLEMIHEQGVYSDRETEGGILIAVCEALTNCETHGGCDEAEIEVSVSGQDVAVNIIASCYHDPEAKNWFGKNYKGDDSSFEHGRGGLLISALTKQVDVSPDDNSVCLLFNFPAIGSVPSAA